VGDAAFAFWLACCFLLGGGGGVPLKGFIVARARAPSPAPISCERRGILIFKFVLILGDDEVALEEEVPLASLTADGASVVDATAVLVASDGEAWPTAFATPVLALGFGVSRIGILKSAFFVGGAASSFGVIGAALIASACISVTASANFFNEPNIGAILPPPSLLPGGAAFLKGAAGLLTVPAFGAAGFFATIFWVPDTRGGGAAFFCSIFCVAPPTNRVLLIVFFVVAIGCFFAGAVFGRGATFLTVEELALTVPPPAVLGGGAAFFAAVNVGFGFGEETIFLVFAGDLGAAYFFCVPTFGAIFLLVVPLIGGAAIAPKASRQTSINRIVVLSYGFSPLVAWWWGGGRFPPRIGRRGSIN